MALRHLLSKHVRPENCVKGYLFSERTFTHFTHLEYLNRQKHEKGYIFTNSQVRVSKLVSERVTFNCPTLK